MAICLIGACDRNNFGDLLMPIVFEKQFEKYSNLKTNFITYGQVKSNLTNIKANKTRALHEVYNNSNVLVFVGGEILSADYTLMYYNLQKNYFKLFFIRCIHKILPILVEKYAKKVLKGKTASPWVLNKNMVGCKKIIYNTVGGSVNQNSIEDLKTSDYISIRNIEDFEQIKKYVSNISLCPDSITSISRLLSDEEIEKNVENDIMEMCREKYFIVQTDKRNSKDLIDIIADQIKKICKKHNINCILLPIGYAQGHEDQVALMKIYKKCGSEHVKISRKTNIYETLYILRHSSFFVGTSLHGIVISTSYCIPHMILTNKINKLLYYMKTWKTSPVLYTEASEMCENFENIYNNSVYQKKLKKKREELIKRVDNNFKTIDNIIVKELKNE